jgi:hypothetical protein
MNKLTVPLTLEQQQLIKNATGKSITELHLAIPTEGQLTEAQLGEVQGGAIDSFMWFSQPTSSSEPVKGE